MANAPAMSPREHDEVALAARLIQLHSPTGAESPATTALVEAMQELGYDEAGLDEAGNAVGTFRRGDGPSIVLNGHLDTVPLGDETQWPHPPLSGAIADDRLWGRGACDMKSAVACQTLAARDAVDAGFRGTLTVAAVVQEEDGGFGARVFARGRRADVVLLGEPSKLQLKLGHRGRLELHVRFEGRIAHAARSSLGQNALYPTARFLSALEQLELPRGGPLEGSSATPTQLVSHPRKGPNVVPGAAELIVDYRNIPEDSPGQVQARIAALLGPDGSVRVPTRTVKSEDGAVQEQCSRVVLPYQVPTDSPLVPRAQQILAPILASHGMSLPEPGYWWFATDAPELAPMGGPVLGFGPGEEELAHTTRESVPLSHLAMAREAYRALVLGLLP